MNCGIYKITNLITGDFYIGQSINLKSRKAGHWHNLNKNKYGNTHFQNSWNKYGKENFAFEVLLYCEPFELTRYEQWFVDNKNPGYNIRRECTNSNRGVSFSEEFKEKQRTIHTGRVFSEEHKRNISLATTGKKHGKMSNEQKAKISQTTKGKKCTEEHKQRVSIAKKTSNSNTEHLRKLAESQRGKPLSEEHKLKLSLSIKRWWENRRNG